jgi:hypothetical protein
VLWPVVDGVGGNAELGGGVLDADFAVLDGDGAWTPNLVGVSDAGDTAGGERLAFASGQASRVELVGQLLTAVGRSVAADQVQRRGAGPSGPRRLAASSSVAPVCQREESV